MAFAIAKRLPFKDRTSFEVWKGAQGALQGQGHMTHHLPPGI